MNRTDLPSPGMRRESDSMGALDVPADAWYGAQTQRAVLNFPISGQPMPVAFVRALLMIKGAAAEANGALQVIDAACASAISQSCEALLALQDEALMRHFPVDVFQTGSGTSTNIQRGDIQMTYGLPCFLVR